MHALNRSSRGLRFATVMLPLVAFAHAARADIFQWEYINPADPSQGKRQSTTLAPDGAGVDAVPGANLATRNLTMAYLNQSNLTNSNFRNADLTNATLSQANLTAANFSAATLSDVNFSGAELRRATFEIFYDLDARRFGTGISLNQLYSTASYQHRELSGINLTSNNLAGGNFDAQNLADARFWSADLSHATLNQAVLTNVRFDYAHLTGASLRESNLMKSVFLAATLTDADFTGAEIKGANFGRYYFLGTSIIAGTGLTPPQLYSTANYQARDLSGIRLGSNDLTAANFVGQNLSNTSLYGATLTGADFTDATIRGTDFGKHPYYGTGITLAQLYSTASYNAHDLRSVGLVGSDLSGGNFTAQNLTDANFRGATLTDAVFTAADARGAALYAPTSAVTINLIWPDGHIDGLNLDAGGLLMVRDYDGDSPWVSAVQAISVTVDQHLAMGPGGTLRMVFEADDWDSTVSFASGIPVTLGGTLELTFAADVNLASQVGRTFDLFDWTGVNPTGAFNVSSHYAWDLSNLYATGQVMLTAIPEPSATVLLLAALGALALYRKSEPRIKTAAFILPLVACSTSAYADIYQWEYIDPADLSQGKRQSTTLAPDGAGIDAVPGADLSKRNLTWAYLIGADLMNGNGSASNLTDADLTQANLTNANFSHATLTNANFFHATLTAAGFTGAEVRGAGFGLCSFVLCRGSGINLTQLYSIASYQTHDLSGIGLSSHNLAGGEFGGQNLTNADFGAANLTDANFREANLANASFVGFRRSCQPLAGCNHITLALATLEGVDFTIADTRGAILSVSSFSSATTTNLIQPDGHIRGLDLDAGGRIVVRDHDGDSRFEPAKPPIPITVEEHLEIDPGGTLRMVFEADAWDSTISFAPSIPVTLGGTLELSFASDVNPATQVGRTFALFDWTGVLPAGVFNIRSPYNWDLSRIYTTGEVTLTAVPEPTSAVMAATLGALVLRRRRLLYRVSFVNLRKTRRRYHQTIAIQRT